ncbi:MAG: hypothetical protein RI894_2162 [Bacteroidota bacterium]
MGADPEIRTLESGVSVAKLNLATNENYKDKDGNWQTETEWHTVIAWRDLANRLQSQAKKGSLLYVEGKLTHRSWTDAAGQPRKATEVLANLVRVLDKREGTPSYNQSVMPTPESQDTGAAQNITPPQVTPPQAADDLPF